jgi:hypothetical protein
MPPGCTPSTGGKGVPVLLEISGLGETTRWICQRGRIVMKPGNWKPPRLHIHMQIYMFTYIYICAYMFSYVIYIYIHICTYNSCIYDYIHAITYICLFSLSFLQYFLADWGRVPGSPWVPFNVSMGNPQTDSICRILPSTRIYLVGGFTHLEKY